MPCPNNTPLIKTFSLSIVYRIQWAWLKNKVMSHDSYSPLNAVDSFEEITNILDKGVLFGPQSMSVILDLNGMFLMI